MAKDKAHHDHARLISLDGRTERNAAHALNTAAGCSPSFSLVRASRREIEKLIAVCYITPHA